jgi:hypothetical protein
MLTAERRNEMDRAKLGRAIRVSIYELGALIGAIYFSTVADMKLEPWSLRAVVMGLAVGLWIYMITSALSEWKSLRFLEKRLDEDLDKRESL